MEKFRTQIILGAILMTVIVSHILDKPQIEIPKPKIQGKKEFIKEYPRKELEKLIIIREDNEDSLRRLYDLNHPDYDQDTNDNDKTDNWYGYYN